MTPAPAIPEGSAKAPPFCALESLMRALEARIPNLHPKNRGRAEGIIRNVRNYGTCTEKQKNELVRLEQLSKKKWRAPKPKAQVFEPSLYTGSHNGHRYISAEEKCANARWQYAEDKARNSMSSEDFTAWKKARWERFMERDRRSARSSHRDVIFRQYSFDRERVLKFTFPHLDRPQLMGRDKLITGIFRRLRRIGIRTRYRFYPGTYDDWRIESQRLRAILITEGIARFKDRKQARLLQESE